MFTVESLSRLSGESQDASQEKTGKVKMSELRDALEETCSSDVEDVAMETETVWRLADGMWFFTFPCFSFFREGIFRIEISEIQLYSSVKHN